MYWERTSTVHVEEDGERRVLVFNDRDNASHRYASAIYRYDPVSHGIRRFWACISLLFVESHDPDCLPSGSCVFCQFLNGSAMTLLNTALDSSSVGVPSWGVGVGSAAIAAASSGSTMVRWMRDRWSHTEGLLMDPAPPTNFPQ